MDRVVATGSRELFNPAILVTRPAHIGLNTWESRGGSPPAPGSTGLFHTAILYPTRAALADALRRLIAAGIRLDGASDHGVSEALYLRDPDQNGVEFIGIARPSSGLGPASQRIRNGLRWHRIANRSRRFG